MRYPNARWVPWKYLSPTGLPTYYRGVNRPTAVVLHMQQGYASTAERWALSGYYGASWHYTIDRDGNVMQHLDHADGGYHAGILGDAPNPTWPLWRGHGQNVNHYTIGVECEGFAGTPFSPVQAEVLRSLCRWLAEVLGFPFERERFPAHAEIDVVNRVNDFNPPAMREQFYAYLFEEDDVTPQQATDLANLVAIFGGSAKIAEAARQGMDYMLGYAIEQQKLSHHIAQHPGPVTIPDHIHTPGKVVQQ